MSAWYPENPTTEQRTSMTQFIQGLSLFYPCTYCAVDFQENIQKHPVAADSRENLCLWMCQQHNFVNTKLGKPLFPCTIDLLDQRWRKADPKK